MKLVILPELGEGIEKATIAYWHFQIGDKVSEGDDIVEIVTDKASFNVASDYDGKLAEIKCQIGEEIRIGETLAVIEPS